MRYLVFPILLIFVACFPGPGIIPGPVGPQGPKGDSGIDATQITIVQFCPGTTSYPTEFNEVGLCINNKLYAVYSLNNGFLVEIPPGQYQSNALNSNCTFTVLPNCVIQN